MWVRAVWLRSLVVGGVLAGPMVYAADPSQQAPIAGQDVMGDKSRSGPDGWAWAPVTRNQAPSGHAAGQTNANVAAAPDARPGSNEHKSLPQGQDPGTPAAAAPNGPGTLDAPAYVSKPGHN